jgi:nitroreductase
MAQSSLRGHMDIFDTIQGRKSIRRFKQDPVPDVDLKKILDAGRLAPSASNAQPWSFIVIKDKALLRKMADAVREMVDRMTQYAGSEQEAQRLAAYKSNYYVFFENAPVVIAVLMEPYMSSGLLVRMGYNEKEAMRLRPDPGLQSVSAAIQNMLLAAHALGYGSCWMTGPLVAQEAFERLLGYGKDRFIAALLPMGMPDEDPPARNRKPLSEIVKMIE